MKHRTLSTVTAAAAVALLATACGAAGSANTSAGGYTPRGDVTMVVPFGAGGGSDRSARALESAIEAAVPKLNINVENREGGSGAVGYSFFLSKRGNPETLLATETALLALPVTANVKFTHKDFTPIMKIADDYTLMVATPKSPYSTCAEVVNAARTGRVVAGIAGKTSLDNTIFTLTENATGAKFRRVPFESGGELTAALLGGQIDVASLNPGEIRGQLKSGDIKPLCAFSEKRYEYEDLKDIPTAREQGIDVAFAQFRGVLAPGGISDAQKQYWIDVMTKVVETDEYQKYIEENVLQANTLAGDEFASYLEQNSGLLQQALKG